MATRLLPTKATTMKYLILLFSLICSFAYSNDSKFIFPEGELELLQSQNKLGLYFQLQPDWHIYWKNSGDSGAPPIWKWQLTYAEITQELWPSPQRIPVAGLMNIGYSYKSLFVFELKAQGPFDASLDLEFLVCKVECIPYFHKFKKSFSTLKTDPFFENLQKDFIYPSTAPSELTFQPQSQNEKVLAAVLNIPFEVKNLEIFPEDGQSFQALTPVLEPDGQTVKVKLALQANANRDLNGSAFLIVADKQSFEVKLLNQQDSFFTILFWALLGGLILNLMPCVLPVLSIKILSFAQNDQNLKSSGWLYTLGVLTAFFVLGGSLLILRAGGEQIGWGFQLQSPVIAASLAILFLWVGFNFLGFFEVGQTLANVGSNKKSGAFFTGVLATVVATPCTAPFMGAALGASLALPAYQTMLVFLGLGVGLALPFLILAYIPQALRFLPKPGPWMITLKEFLAFPMFATSIWLLWVLSQQVDTNSLFVYLLIFLCIGFWVWLIQKVKNEKRRQRLLILGFLLSFVLVYFSPAQPMVTTSTSLQTAWKKFSKSQIDEDLENKKSFFIDFTAAWCITCQVNKKAVLNTDEIQKLFQDHQVSIYAADWTHRDPEITKALADFGRNSLPLYVFYQSGSRQPLILPELLTKSMILNLFTDQQEVINE